MGTNSAITLVNEGQQHHCRTGCTHLDGAGARGIRGGICCCCCCCCCCLGLARYCPAGGASPKVI